MIAKRLLVKGKVQGVFFRKHTRQIAHELNIAGWVRNTDEGHVEILAQGDEDSIQKLTAWCRQGPSKADVQNVDVSDAKPDETIKHFSINYD